MFSEGNTYSGKKKLIFHETIYKLPPKNNTIIKYKEHLHVYKIIQAAWNSFKPTYTQANFIYIDKSALIVTHFQTHVLGTQKKRLNETVLLSAKPNDKTGDQNIFTILHSKLCSCIGHMLPFQRLKDRLDFIHLIQCL